jgi:hypothetical protein
MKADRWQKVEQVFHAVLQRIPEERADFLKETCASDSALYRDVKALLASCQQDDSFFENSGSSCMRASTGSKLRRVVYARWRGTAFVGTKVKLVAEELCPPKRGFTQNEQMIRWILARFRIGHRLCRESAGYLGLAN